MITIAIELNHVIRNINKQLLKYYQRDYHPELNIDDIDEKEENVNNEYIKFKSKKEHNEFVYIDYPFEIFGCARPMDKDLPRDITAWIEEMSNREDEEFRVIYYSLGEDALTIQSSYFFLSKLGTRVREVIFPKGIDELKNKCDVIISSDSEVVKWAKENNKKSVRILTNWKTKETTSFNIDENDGIVYYDSMTKIIEDKTFLDKLIEFKKGVKNG